MGEGEVILLENVRFYAGEEKNDPSLQLHWQSSPMLSSTMLLALPTAPTPRQQALPSTSHHVSVVS